jgi:hypothetical protein
VDPIKCCCFGIYVCDAVLAVLHKMRVSLCSQNNGLLNLLLNPALCDHLHGMAELEVFTYKEGALMKTGSFYPGK